MHKKSHSFLLCAAIIMLFSTSAFGYIDMGTGSYVIQIAIAGFAGAVFTLKGYIKSFGKKVVKKIKRK